MRIKWLTAHPPAIPLRQVARFVPTERREFAREHECEPGEAVGLSVRHRLGAGQCGARSAPGCEGREAAERVRCRKDREGRAAHLNLFGAGLSSLASLAVFLEFKRDMS